MLDRGMEGSVMARLADKSPVTTPFVVAIVHSFRALYLPLIPGAQRAAHLHRFLIEHVP